MQGNLKEIDIASILQLLELGQRSGILWVETEEFNSLTYPKPYTYKSFNCFFVNGKITYANLINNDGLARLKDYLQHYKLVNELDNLSKKDTITKNIFEYDCLWLLLQEQIISPCQFRTIIQKMIQETLFELVSIKEGVFYFGEHTITPEITSLEITPLVKKTMQQLKHWQEFYPYIKSPKQCPVIKDEDKLRNFVSPNTYKRLSNWTNGKTSFFQLGRYLNQDFVSIAQAMYPHIQQGWLSLVDLTSVDNTKTKQNSGFSDDPHSIHVIVINNDTTTALMLSSVLDSIGFKLSLIHESHQAFSIILKSLPDLIMCDFPLEDLDPCYICSTLRFSKEHRHIPWIMLTDENNFQQRLRGQLLGVTDFLTKPFDDFELLGLLNKHLKSKY